jgi:SAM-dependent methyltransferase
VVKRPHKLELYEHAVQQPAATVAWLERMFRHGQADAEGPTRLREDFAGAAALAEAWVESHPDRQALAIEKHGPTFRYAERRRGNVADLHLIEADVMDVARPKVQVTAALNFSTFGYHTPAALLAYLRHARRGLLPQGVLVFDAFGGPGAQRLGVQDRPADGFTYHWEQRAFDPLTHRIDCRIHFTLDDGRTLRSAFRYDWRLWTLPELRELAERAGFVSVEVWGPDPRGRFGPRRKLPAAEDWVACLVARRA